MVIDPFRAALAHQNKEINSRKDPENKGYYSNFSIQKTLKATHANVLDLIKEQFFYDKVDLIKFDDFKPLLGNLKFVDLITRSKIKFTSEIDKQLAENYSRVLLYLSKKKGLGKGGNPRAGINTKGPADKFAKKLGPIIEELNAKGLTTLQAKAEYLNKHNIKTLRGKNWTRNAVNMTYKRWLLVKS